MSKSKKEVWEPCPRCGSHRVKVTGMGFMILAGLMCMSIGLWMLIIPVIGFFAGPAAMIIGLLLLIASPFARKQLQCKDCVKTWNYPYQKDAAD